MKPLLDKEIAKNLFELLVWFSKNPQEQSRMGLAKEHVLRMTMNLLRLYQYETGFMQEGKMMQILEKITREGVPQNVQERVQTLPSRKTESWQKALETFQEWQDLAKKAETTPTLAPWLETKAILFGRDVDRAEERSVTPPTEAEVPIQEATPALRTVLTAEEPGEGGEASEQEVPAARPQVGQRTAQRQRLLYLLTRPRSWRGRLADGIRNAVPFLPKPPDERIVKAAMARLQQEEPTTFQAVQSSLGPRLGQIIEQAKARVGSIGEATLISSKKRLQEVASSLSAKAVSRTNLFALRLNEETGKIAPLVWVPQGLATAAPIRLPSFSFRRILVGFWVNVLKPVLILPKFRWLRLTISGTAFGASFIPLPLPAQILGPAQAGLRAGGGGSLALEGLRTPGLRVLAGKALRRGGAVAARSLAAITTGIAAALSALWPVIVVVLLFVVVLLPLYLLFIRSSETATVAEEVGSGIEFEELPPGFEPPPALAVEDIQFALPTRPQDGQICLTQPFTTAHSGVDFRTGMGRKIYPIADGVVFGIGSGEPYGYHVVILTLGKDKDGKEVTIYHLYAHLSRIEVDLEEGVTTNTPLGRSGATGNVYPPGAAHLHLSVSNLCGRTAPEDCFYPRSANPCSTSSNPSYLSCPAECLP